MMEIVKKTIRHLRPAVAVEVARNPTMLAYYAGRFFSGIKAELETSTEVFCVDQMEPVTASGLIYTVVGERRKLLGRKTVANHYAYLFPPHAQFQWTVEDSTTGVAASKFAFEAKTEAVGFSGPTFWFERDFDTPCEDYDIPGLIEFQKAQGIDVDETHDVEVLNNGMTIGGRTLVNFPPPGVFSHKGALQFSQGRLCGIRDYNELQVAGASGSLVIGTAGLITERSTERILGKIATALSENMNTYSCLTLFYADRETTEPLYTAFMRSSITRLACVQAVNELLAGTLGAGHFEAYLLEMQRSTALVYDSRGDYLHSFPGGGFRRYFQFGAIVPGLRG